MSNFHDAHPKSQRVAAAPSLAASVTVESNAMTSAVANWLDVTGWRTADSIRAGANPGDPKYFDAFHEFELEIDCDASETLTGTPKLYACRLAPVTIADDTFTSSGDTHTATAHAMLDGDGPMRVSSSGTLPAGLSAGTDYFVEVAGANTFKLHTTRAGAIAKNSSTVVTTTDGGSGTHTIADVQGSNNADDDTRRFRHTLVGSLNEGSDITVAAQTSYMERIKHSPLTLYYFVTATQTNTETCVVTATPVIQYEE